MNASKVLEHWILYKNAVNLPHTHRYLLVRLHIEQQRFLHFALQAGVLSTDGALCSTLQVNRSLLVGVLAEIKTLFETYAAANGRYETIGAKMQIDWDDHLEPDNDLISLLCVPSIEDGQTKKDTNISRRAEAAARIHRIGRNISQAARNLRTIIVEPKRLFWAAVDHDSFVDLISQIGKLISFLIALLDSSQIRELQSSVATAYLEILQLRNDVGSLTALVKALSPDVGSQETPMNDALSQAVAREQTTQDKGKSYLRRLTQLKIRLTATNELTSTGMAPDSDDFLDAQLAVADFCFDEDVPARCSVTRIHATYRGKRVWIEWKNAWPGSVVCPNEGQIQRRISLLTDLLRYNKPDGFRAAPCLGYIKTVDTGEATRFGVVFEGPSAQRFEVTTLRDLLGRAPKPSLNVRMALCAALARCVHSLHAVSWLHKALRPDNIVFFTSQTSNNLDKPFVSGFELSRPSDIDQWSEKPEFDPAADIYRHPNAQSSQTDGNYRKSYDVYSLGVVMTEIALWRRLEDILGLENLPKTKPSQLRAIQSQLLRTEAAWHAGVTEPCLSQIASACGDFLRDTVELFLGKDAHGKPELSGVSVESPSAIGLDTVERLEQIAAALEEQVIASHIIDLDLRGFASTYAAVRDMADKLLAARDAGQVGVYWPRNFVKRTDSLTTRFNRAALYEDPVLIKSWFELVEQTKAKYGICDEDVYNFDEAGFLMGKITTQLVVTASERRGHPKAIQPGGREWVTFIATINAAGWSILPFLIFTGKYHLSAWYEEAEIPRDWAIAVSKNGWTTNKLGVKWLKHFIKHTDGKVVGARRLLILDGYKSHQSLEFQELCKENNIYTLCMPPHSSHLLQPLDVGCFSPLKRAYSREVESLIRNHINHITKLEFLPAFKAAFDRSFTPANICSAFRGVGLISLQPDTVLSKLDVQLRTSTPPAALAEAL
ncbi:hypothetical protein yc1106_08669 [Curvularia clavata]|uniref:Protein kinase domain-containing protein n=1 Tax=Curvularia clavata TaxID=95742 RepID=A0A9Q8ZGP8_CURCL|nr:hypothetical protein yc1106_08669 [Curvularia clavata]